MAFGVYILCALTSAACSVLLLRGYQRSAVRLLLWSGLCFAGLALENVILCIDLYVVREIDLSLLRRMPSAVAMALLVYGLVWESK